MENIEDVRNRLELELIHWKGRQENNPFAQYYLWFSRTVPGCDGGLIICQDAPNGYQLACPERINKMASVEENLEFFNRFLGTLPILSIAK